MTTPTAPPTRRTADERREAIIQAAIHEFAHSGLAGTSTETIAARAGISQPYLFKLFGTKRALFLASYEWVMTHIDVTLDAAADAHPDDCYGAMEAAYLEVIRQRDHQLMILQAYAAAGDEAVRQYVRERERRTLNEMIEMMNGDHEAARRWYARCVLQAIGAVLDLPEFIG